MSNIKYISKHLFIFVLFICCCFTSGCWNYKEVNQFAAVAGMAIDKKDGLYLVTVEIYSTVSGQGQLTLNPVVYSNTGKTLFDAVRGIIVKTGQKLYWSHAKVIIINKHIARESVLPVIDWPYRDAEIRTDMWTFVSKEKTAMEIFKGNVELNDILSYQLNKIMQNEKAVSKSPQIDLWKFTSTLSERGASSIMPTISLVKSDSKKVPNVSGAAIFKADKLVGYINGPQTMNLLFIQNKIKGGVLPFKIAKKDNVTLEILGSKTLINPTVKNGHVTMHINITTKANIAEIQGTTDYTSIAGMKMLKAHTEIIMKKKLTHFISYIQNHYGTDIFGYSNILLHKEPRLWKKVIKHWPSFFKSIKSDVNVSFDLQGSATVSKPIKLSK